MRLFRRHFILREENTGGGNDLPSGSTTQDPDAQAILDQMNGVTPDYGDVDEKDGKDNILPSDNKNNNDDNNGGDDSSKGALLAGKYKTVDDLKKGINAIGNKLPESVINSMSNEGLVAYYQELSKSFSTKDKKHQLEDDKKDEGKSDGKKHEINEDDDKDNKDDSKDGTEAPKGVPQELWTSLETTFTEKGGITTKQYAELEKHGIPEQVVDNYIDGIIAKQNEFTRSVYDLAGGQEQYKVIESWANENLSENEINYISGLKGDAQLLALKGVKAQYDLANSGTQRINGNTNDNNSGSSYAKTEDYIRDVEDPRYRSSPAFRDKVAEKYKRSKF